MSRKRMITKKKKIVLLVGTAALVGSAAFAMTGTGNAGQRQGNESSRCNGLTRLAADHQRFIANERANPNVNSRARIANSTAAIRQIRQQQQSAGCNGSGRRQAVPPGDRQGGGAQRGGRGRCNGLARLKADHQRFIANERAKPNVNSRARIANSTAAIRQIRQQQQSAGCNGAGRRQAGRVVCAGSTVTLSGEGGAPAASSNQFPAGTQLRVTNLDNNRSTTVKVNSPSGSCVLLNNAAFEQVREPGRNVIRNVRVERVG
ncbi:hypothetical protein ACFWDI_27735 [Streptomyces sp. NPDC060064]|uniref:hypothetical protein n=1 Tax=Streptomyces sp. NPDC060064 TaxID=3347049 RepID=UPI0036C34503